MSLDVYFASDVRARILLPGSWQPAPLSELVGCI